MKQIQKVKTDKSTATKKGAGSAVDRRSPSGTKEHAN